MAIPSLKQQIEFVDTIVVLTATAINGVRRYQIVDVLKSKYAGLNNGDLINADFSLFELLGYRIQTGQQVVALLAIRKNMTDYDCIDFLPVSEGMILYGKDDAAVRQHVSLRELRSMTGSLT